MLKEFCKSYLEMADIPQEKWKQGFAANRGLCVTLSLIITVSDYRKTRDCLENALLQMYGDCYHPFGGFARYTSERELSTMYTNPMRLAFCKLVADSEGHIKAFTDDFGNTQTKEVGSYLLKDFGSEVLNWVATGGDESTDSHKSLDRNFGLCWSLDRFMHGKCIHQLTQYSHSKLMKTLLYKLYGSATYPFGGERLFDSEGLFGTKYKNPMRLAFCKYISDKEDLTNITVDDFGNVF